jgi:hypothetical protein
MRLQEKILKDIQDDEVGDIHYTRILKSMQYLCKTAIVVAEVPDDCDANFRCCKKFFFLKPYTEYEFNLWLQSQSFLFEELDNLSNQPIQVADEKELLRMHVAIMERSLFGVQAYMICDLLLEREAFIQIFLSLVSELTFEITESGQLKILLKDLNAYINSDMPGLDDVGQRDSLNEEYAPINFAPIGLVAKRREGVSDLLQAIDDSQEEVQLQLILQRIRDNSEKYTYE